MTQPAKSRQRAPFTVVRVRRIKHRATDRHLTAKPRRDAPQDLASLILYGQG